MCCYAVPLIGAATTTAASRKNKSKQLTWLNLMLWGGAIFGVVDHWWNGELFLISENLASDLLLGIAITASIFAIWFVLVLKDKSSPQPIQAEK